MKMMRSRNLLAAAGAVVLVGTLSGPGIAQAQTVTPDAPVLLVLDKDALDYGPPPHLLPEGAVDVDIAAPGVPGELPYFQNHLDSQVVLPSGQAGSDGWFALRSVPAAWTTADGVDGLSNFALAGPGLGSPDDNGERESLLASVPDVVPVQAGDVALLVGRMVCAVVYSGDLAIAPGTLTNLQGPTLGRIAFTVVSLAPTDDPAHPSVQVQVAEGHEVCSGRLAPYPDGQ
jgi:hypothetical protein